MSGALDPFQDFYPGRLGLYTLDPNRIPLPCASLIEWAQWYETADRAVAQEFIGEGKEYWVSTVFLALDHNHGFGARRDPLLFETMVFLDGEGGDMDRYCTWAEAAAGHERICQMLRHELAEAGRLSFNALRALMQAQTQTTPTEESP